MNGYGGQIQADQQTIPDLQIGEPRCHQELCIVPLFSSSDCGARYMLLDGALRRRTLTVTEVGEAGEISCLKAVNKGPWPVLAFDGEELVGAKQNRICNTTLLIGVGTSVLPVSCTEQGRWQRRSAVVAAAADRAQGSAEPAIQRVRAARYTGAQHRVWEEVSATIDRLGVKSDTEALADGYKTQARDIHEYIEALGFTGGASGEMVGVVVFFEGRFVYLDLLRPAAKFTRLYAKLLRGYALEALVASNKRDFLAAGGVDRIPLPSCAEPHFDFDPEGHATHLLDELRDSTPYVQAAVDLGEDLRFTTENLAGAGLTWCGELIQLSAFPRRTV